MKVINKFYTKSASKSGKMLVQGLLFLGSITLCVGAPASAATVEGFVTNIDSRTEFKVGTMHVLLNAQTSCKTKRPVKPSSWLTITSLVQCRSIQLAIGSRVRLVGSKQDLRGFVAEQVTVYLAYGSRTLERETLIEETPMVRPSARGWSGKLWVDGYPMTVTPKTKLLSTHDSQIPAHLLAGVSPSHTREYSKSVHEFTSSSLLKPNTWATYHVTRAADGTITAMQLWFWPNQADATGEEFLRMFTAKIETPCYSKHIPGSIQYKYGSPIQILPYQGVQNYVSQLGMTLVPQYQKELPANDPTKIDFHFYVIHPFIATPGNHLVELDGGLQGVKVFIGNHYRYNRPKYNTIVQNVIAMPNGKVLIPDVLLARMQNEAQVAALLSYAITSIAQWQAYYARPSITSPRVRQFGMNYANVYLFARTQDEQLLRIGIRQMYLEGYDIREAPFAWAVAQGKPVSNPVINSKHPDKEIPWYAAYAFNYISRYYKDVDYSKLKRGRREYQQFLQELRKADPEAFASQPGSKPAAKSK